MGAEVDVHDLEELRTRLEEAEETISAILQGDIDALVVQESSGERIYTFQGVEHVYRLLIEQINEGAATLSAEGRILYGNRRLGEMLKVPLGRVIGSSLGSFVDEEDQKDLGRMLATGQEEHIQSDIRLRATDGSLSLVLVSLTPLRLDTFSGISAILTDLTKRKKEEAAAHLAAIVNTSDDAIISKSLDGTILSWNPGAERMYGYSETEAVGQHISFLLPPGQANEFPAIVSSLMRGERIDHYETTRRRKDGQVLQVSVGFSLLRDAAGSIVAAAAIARDISERKRTEEQLRKLSRAIEQSPSSIVITDTRGAIEYVNPKFTEVSGYTLDEVRGKNPRILKSGETEHEEYRRLWETVLSGREWRGEFHNRKKNGELFWESASISPVLDERRVVTHFIAIKDDITERKQAEEALASAHKELASQAENLTRSNRELEQFAYVASHDLQEPLRMVASYLELLADRYKGRLDEKADKFINYAVDGASRMKILIDDLLSYSRVTTKERSVEPIEVGAALDEATRNLGKAIGDKGAVLTRSALPSVVVDRTHLVQLFQNLIGNALKFCDDTPSIHVWAEPHEQGWVFSVRDNGIGIAPEHRERVFQIFQRLHGRGKYAGTGIGLAICKKIVEQYGGRIWVESQPGTGSTFFFTLPAVD